MKHTIYATHKNILLRPLSSDDIEFLRVWRNNPDNSRFLRPLPELSPEMQLLWFYNDLADTDSYTFGIVETESLNCLVGSICLYHFIGPTCEQGRSILGDKGARGVTVTAFTLAHHIGYCHFGLNKIVAEVNKKNISSIMLARKIGFSVSGQHKEFGEEHWDFEQTDDTFYDLYPEMKKITIHTDWKTSQSKNLETICL